MEPESRYPIDAPRVEGAEGPRKLVAFVLLAIGSTVALMVVERVFRVLSQGSDFPLIERMIGERGTLTTPGGDIVLPEAFYVLASYGIAIALLGIAAGIARAFLASGTQLLHLDIRTVLRTLREQRTASGTPPASGRSQGTR